MESPLASPSGTGPNLAPPAMGGASSTARFALRVGGALKERSRAMIAVLSVSGRARTITGFSFIIGGLLSAVASLTLDNGVADLTGRFGILSSQVLFGLFGKAAYLFGPALIWSGLRGLARDDWNAYLSGLLGNLSLLWSLAVFFHLSGRTPPGIAGEQFGLLLEFFTGRAGAYLINSLLMFMGILLLLQIPFDDVKQKIADFLEGRGENSVTGQPPIGTPQKRPLDLFLRWLPFIALIPLAIAFLRRRSPTEKAPTAAPAMKPESPVDLNHPGGLSVLSILKRPSDLPPWIQRVEVGGESLTDSGESEPIVTATPIHDPSQAVNEADRRDAPAPPTSLAFENDQRDRCKKGQIWRPGEGFLYDEKADGAVESALSIGDEVPQQVAEASGLIIEEDRFPFPMPSAPPGIAETEWPEAPWPPSEPRRRTTGILYDPAKNRYLFQRTVEEEAPRQRAADASGVDYLGSLELSLPEGGWGGQETTTLKPPPDTVTVPQTDSYVEDEDDEECREAVPPNEDENEIPSALSDEETPAKRSSIPAAVSPSARPSSPSPAMLFPVVLSENRYSSYRLSRRVTQQSPRVESENPEREIEETGEKLKKVMSDFGVQATVEGAVRGPMITMYEVRPQAGVRVNRFMGIQDEIRMNLAAMSVRVVAPIPGRSTIGVELPNRTRQFVSMGDLVNGDPEFSSGKRELSIALGKDIQGVNRYLDLTRLPHLLIAGATGSGKSVFMNSIIASLLFNHSPDDVRFLMIDPKMVELKLYEGIPHLLYPVITDVRLADRALAWAVMEMESRYQLLSNVKCRDLRSYNDRIRSGDLQGPTMPYIVLLIDELSDLMMVSAKEVEDSIIRLTQKARAVGIHVIMATQRPSVDVITSLIKANCPARISFQVAQKIDSRIILDMNGAESLLGKGDMLYKSPTAAELVRIQSPMISEGEIEQIVREASRLGRPRFIELPGREEEGQGAEDSGDVDQALVDAAWEIIQETGKTSTSYVQRRLRIGYNRAATIIERLEQMGYLGPAIGNRPREILKRH